MPMWFETSKKGLNRLARERGADRIFLELVSNALDEVGVTEINVSLLPVPNKPLAVFHIEDNSPEGFKDLSHAYTIFAESYKRDNPEQRGQFNLGEKMFLSLCNEAKVHTTKGTIVFDPNDGRVEMARQKREKGTAISGTFELTRAEYESLSTLMETLMLPEGVKLTFNEKVIPVRQPLKVVEATLPTKIADAEGVMRVTERKTKVGIYQPLADEIPFLYEMGIGVVETECTWSVNVHQKVILDKDRSNVTPAYKRKLFTVVAEAMREDLTQDDASGWGNIVLEDKNASPEVINKLMDERFGKNRATFDPKDPESAYRGTAAGATIVYGRSLSSTQWENVRRSNAIVSSSSRWATPKPYSDNPMADVVTVIMDLTEGMELIQEYAIFLGKELMNIGVRVRFVKAPNNQFVACYAEGGALDFNVSRLGKKWFENGVNEEIDALLLHEYGHQYSSNHLSEEYHDALCKLGAKLKSLALKKPELFKRFM